MQLYDISVEPNKTRQLDAQGSYFYYYSGDAGGADTTITIRGLSSGLRIILKPGQAYRLPQGNKETSWVLTNYTNTATIVGNVIVGDGDITDNRITGSVEVIDSSQNRVNANIAFGSSIRIATQVGYQNSLGISNPSTSTKKVFVNEVSIYTSDATTGFLFITNGNFGTSDNTYPTGFSKNGGTRNLNKSVLGYDVPAVGVSYSANGLSLIRIPAGGSFTKKFSDPICINPNYRFGFSTYINPSVVGEIFMNLDFIEI